MEEILNLEGSPAIRDSIECIELHSHYPYASSKLSSGDEIRISLQHQDLYTLPSRSVLYIEGKFIQQDGVTIPRLSKLTNNAIAFLFDEIRYELSGVEVDRTKNPGITSTLKNLVSLRGNSNPLEYQGWCYPLDDFTNLTSAEGGEFNVVIPLAKLLGVFEDYPKIMLNVKQELILIRSRWNENCYKTSAGQEAAAEPCKVEMLKLCWKIPYVTVNEHQKLILMRHLRSERTFCIPFRSWELFDYPLLPASTRQIWAVKTSSQMEKPRYVILAFQINRQNNAQNDSSQFDHCDLTNVKLYLNCKSYPYDDMNLDFSANRYALLYHMYATFQQSYYEGSQNIAAPISSWENFKNKAPLVVIDCSKQSESIKTGPVDVRLEFESKTNFPPLTTAYCLIIHDRAIEYNPLTGIVRRMV